MLVALKTLMKAARNSGVIRLSAAILLLLCECLLTVVAIDYRLWSVVLVPYEASENSEKTVFKPIPRVDYGYSKSNTRHSRSRYE
jgi:hypothetical protein